MINPLLKSFLKPFINGYKHRRKSSFFRQFIKPGDLCFDVGANEGDFSTLFLELDASVVAIEPQPIFLEKLRTRLGSNERFKIVPAALSEKPGMMQLSICSSRPNISTLSDKWKTGRFKEYSWDQQINVAVTTLDELIKQFGIPKFCKIDVEGYEKEVLSGLSVCDPIISFEYTKEFLHTNAIQCIDHLKAIGYRLFNMTGGEEPFFQLTSWSNDTTVIQAIDEKADPLYWGDIYAVSLPVN